MDRKSGLVTGMAVTGGALLSTGMDADAAIVYSGELNITMSAGNTRQSIAIRNGASVGVSLRISYGPMEGIVHQTGNSIYFAYNGKLTTGTNHGTTSYRALRFSKSSTIAATAWMSTRAKLFSYKSAAFNGLLNFNDGNVPGYVGFRIGDGNLYGWMQVSSIAANGSSFVIKDWAYDDTGGTIKAGQTTSGGGAVPEPSGLALLACGAAGVYALRRKKYGVTNDGQ